MESLSHGLRRMLATPARAALRTPDPSEEGRCSDAQPAGACAEEPADASAAAPARELLSVSNCCAAPSASSTTSAALQNPLSGPRSGSNPHEPDHASASAHDSDSFALTGTNYIPYTGRILQVGSVPGYNPPVSSDRASVQGPLLLAGPGPVDALDDSRPPETAVPPLRDDAFFDGHLSDTRMTGALSCPDRARPEAVSIPPGTSADPSDDASGDAHGAPAAVRVFSRHGAPIVTEAVAAHPSGTSYCPGRATSRESASFLVGTVRGDHDHAAPDAHASSNLALSTSRGCDVSEGFDQAPLADGPFVALPPSRSAATGACLPPSRLPPDRQAPDVSGGVPAPPPAPSSRRSLEHDLSAAAPAPDRSEFSSRVASSSPFDEDEKAAMLDEIDHHRHLSTEAIAKCRKLTLENAALSEQLRLTAARPVMTSDASNLASAGPYATSSDRPPVPAPPSRRLPPDPPPPHAPYDADVTSPSSLALGACPAWHCDVISPSGHALTKPLPSWKDSQLLAPRTAAILKSRQSQQSGLERLNNLFGLMARNPGMVASTYSRLIQCLVDHYVSFSSLNGADVGTPALNLETFRFLSDACSATSCPPNVAMCFLECCSSYSSCPDAVPSDSPSHSELLLRHALSSLIFELSPPSTALLEIAFNSATKLADGENIFDFVARIREAASKNNTPQRVVHLRILSAVQEASNNPLANQAVINEVSNRLSAMMTRSESLHSFLSSLKTVAGVGGCLNEPIIHRSPISVVPGDSPHERS